MLPAGSSRRLDRARLTVLMISFGWRWMFVSMGLIGIVVAIVWYTVYREVVEAALSAGEAHHLR